MIADNLILGFLYVFEDYLVGLIGILAIVGIVWSALKILEVH